MYTCGSVLIVVGFRIGGPNRSENVRHLYMWDVCITEDPFEAFLANTAFYKLWCFQRVNKLLQFLSLVSALSAMTTWQYDPHWATKTKRLALKILRLGFSYGGPSNKIKVNFTDAISFCGCQFEFSIRGHLVRDLEPKHHRVWTVEWIRKFLGASSRTTL